MTERREQAGPRETEAAEVTGGPAAPTLLFISDCHLCADDSAEDRARQQRVIRFLQSIDPRTTHLYIVGDLFDFWFTYATAIPRRGFAVLAELAALKGRGLPVTFVAGNHDYWALPFLRDELGFDTTADALERTLYGRRFYIAHGDGLGSGDLGYKLLKHLFRNRLAIALYRLLHPDLGIRLATASSRLSRDHGGGNEAAQIDRLAREVAAPAFSDGIEVAIFGHFHLPVLRREPAGTLVVLGDWLHHFSYLRVDADGLQLLEHADGGAPRVLAASPWSEAT